MPKEQPHCVRSNAVAEVWKREEALERIGGDEALLQELCQIFLRGYPRLLKDLREALALNDASTLQRVAHSLKGELGYLSAPEATQIARSLEDMGREKDLSTAAAALAALEKSLAALHLAIDPSKGIH